MTRERLAVFRARFLGVGVDEGVDAFDQRVREALLDGAACATLRRPWLPPRPPALAAFSFSPKVDEPLGGVGPAVEQHVLDEFEQLRLDLLVHFEHAGVDDAHVQPGLDGVVEKRASASPRARGCCRGS